RPPLPGGEALRLPALRTPLPPGEVPSAARRRGSGRSRVQNPLRPLRFAARPPLPGGEALRLPALRTPLPPGEVPSAARRRGSGRSRVQNPLRPLRFAARPPLPGGEALRLPALRTLPPARLVASATSPMPHPAVEVRPRAARRTHRATGGDTGPSASLPTGARRRPAATPVMRRVARCPHGRGAGFPAGAGGVSAAPRRTPWDL